VEPFTHAFSSLALARAGQRRLPRFGAAMLIVSGVLPDLDYASYFGGPAAFIQFHRTALHSIAGSAVMACAVAGAFWVLDRKMPPKKLPQRKTVVPLAFGAALATCAIGAVGHVILDVASGDGVQLLWPFRAHWSSWDLATDFDPWILFLLIAGLLLPLLFKLVSEEVGERKKGSGGSGAVIVLLLLVAYLGMRARFHGEAIELLLSREYHGRIPLSAGAFPESSAPFQWRGVVVTDNTIEEVPVPLGPGEEFDPNVSVTHYKPEDSPALDIGEKTPAAAKFLAYASWPLASVHRREAGYRFEIHDLRFAPGDYEPASVFVRVDFDSNLQIKHEEFHFASSPND
jgi:membrane-bound metal-dependent hydrolase YbcI (DUF457 family)